MASAPPSIAAAWSIACWASSEPSSQPVRGRRQRAAARHPSRFAAARQASSNAALKRVFPRSHRCRVCLRGELTGSRSRATPQTRRFAPEAANHTASMVPPLAPRRRDATRRMTARNVAKIAVIAQADALAPQAAPKTPSLQARCHKHDYRAVDAPSAAPAGMAALVVVAQQLSASASSPAVRSVARIAGMPTVWLCCVYSAVRPSSSALLSMWRSTR